MDAYTVLVRQLRNMSDASLEAMLQSLYEFGENESKAAEAMIEVLADRGRSDIVYALEGVE